MSVPFNEFLFDNMSVPISSFFNMSVPFDEFLFNEFVAGGSKNYGYQTERSHEVVCRW